MQEITIINSHTNEVQWNQMYHAKYAWIIRSEWSRTDSKSNSITLSTECCSMMTIGRGPWKLYSLATPPPHTHTHFWERNSFDIESLGTRARSHGGVCLSELFFFFSAIFQSIRSGECFSFQCAPDSFIRTLYLNAWLDI